MGVEESRDPCMSYRIEADESLEEGVRRVADEQIEKALDSLDLDASESTEKAGEAIHDARKRFKKIRAVLRLVRIHVGEEVFDRENVEYRDAGRLLSDAREGDVAVATLAGLREDFGDVLADDAFDAFRAKLVERRETLVAEATRPAGPVDEVRGRIREARGRVPEWPLEELDVDGVLAGVRKVYERGRNRMADAYDDPSGPAFHEWRKRVKYLWYHLRLLTPWWPELLETRAELQHDLADLLGEANDFTDLVELLREHGDTLLPDVRAQDAVVGLATRRRREYWLRARPLGARLYADAPDDFVARLATYREALSIERDEDPAA